MKIVQSLWSKAIKDNAGWASESMHYMSWALSCLSLKEIYSEVELVTDEAGYHVLIEKLELPYTKVYVRLNNIDKYGEKLWTLGKVYAYSIQDSPFIHIDGDVYVWEKFPDQLLNASLIAQNREENYPPNIRYIKNLIDKGLVFSEELMPANEIPMVNAGILGGSNIDFFKEYTATVFSFIDRNRAFIDSMPNQNLHALNIIFEQYFFYRLADKRNMHIDYLFGDSEIDLTYAKLLDFYSVPRQTKYIHVIGKAKKNLLYGELIAKQLWSRYPYHYNKVISLTKTTNYDITNSNTQPSYS